MPKIDIARAPERKGSKYPAPFDKPLVATVRKQLAVAAGLADFGVNLLTLPPGAWSSQRHWHDRADEFVFVVAGEVVLVTDAGETPLKAGDCAGFPKNTPDGHHLINRGLVDAVVLEVGTPTSETATVFSDIDMKRERGADVYLHKDGTPYPTR